MPLLLTVYKAPNGTNGARYRLTLPVTFFRYWEERGFEIKRVEFIETPEGEIVLKPIKTPIQTPILQRSPRNDFGDIPGTAVNS